MIKNSKLLRMYELNKGKSKENFKEKWLLMEKMYKYAASRLKKSTKPSQRELAHLIELARVINSV